MLTGYVFPVVSLAFCSQKQGLPGGFPSFPSHPFCFPWETGGKFSLPHPLRGGGREGKTSLFSGVSGQGNQKGNHEGKGEESQEGKAKLTPPRRILCPFCGNPTRCPVCSSHPGDQSPQRAAEEAAATCRGLYPHQARQTGKETDPHG